MRFFGLAAKFALIVLAALLLARALYTTEPGNWLLRQVPAAFWRALHESFGLQGAETTATAEAIVLFLVCLLVSTALVLATGALVRRLSRRRSRGRAASPLEM